MLEELFKEIQELREYKRKYEHAVKDKEYMSALLYKYMIKEYEGIPYEERAESYKNDWCRHCEHRNYYDSDCWCYAGVEELPDDIRKPIPSDRGYVPALKSCEHFEWS